MHTQKIEHELNGQTISDVKQNETLEIKRGQRKRGGKKKINK